MANPPATRTEVIKQMPAIKKALRLLQKAFPAVTPSDRICAFYEPQRRFWHIACCNYTTYHSAKYKNWCKMLRKMFPAANPIFVCLYIVSSDMEQREAKSDQQRFWLE